MDIRFLVAREGSFIEGQYVLAGADATLVAIDAVRCVFIGVDVHHFLIEHGSLAILTVPEIEVRQEKFLVDKEVRQLFPAEGRAGTGHGIEHQRRLFILLQGGEGLHDADQAGNQSVERKPFCRLLRGLHVRNGDNGVRDVRHLAELNAQLEIDVATERGNVSVAFVVLIFRHVVTLLHEVKVVETVVTFVDDAVERSRVEVGIGRVVGLGSHLLEVGVGLIGDVHQVAAQLTEDHQLLAQFHKLGVDAKDVLVGIIDVRIGIFVFQRIVDVRVHARGE